MLRAGTPPLRSKFQVIALGVQNDYRTAVACRKRSIYALTNPSGVEPDFDRKFQVSL